MKSSAHYHDPEAKQTGRVAESYKPISCPIEIIRKTSIAKGLSNNGKTKINP